jgi:hypothetical protein
MATSGVLDSTITIPAATNYWLQLLEQIFIARDFADVDGEICTAIKIMVGLEALNQDIQSTNNLDRQRILVTLNSICHVYNPQMAPTL